MDPRLAHVLAEAALIAALVAGLIAVTMLAAGYTAPTPLAALGWLVVLLGGVGARLKRRAGPR